MEEALTAALLANPGLLALLSNADGSVRIYWGQRPQGDRLPAIRLNRVTPGLDYVMDGVVSLTQATIQADCFGATYDDAHAVREAVRAAVHALTTDPFEGAFVTGMGADFDPGTGDGPIHLLRLDVELSHNPT
jgi:hypothetical protein